MNENNFIIKTMMHLIQHYNHKKYWKMRSSLKSSDLPVFVKIFYLLRIKRMDAFNNASFGTHLNCQAEFANPPHLPHGIRGIFISHQAIIGKNSTIYQQVTIGDGKYGAPVIGDNCFIGAGAKIIGKIKIGHNVRIGAGCVVATDIPDNCTVVMESPRIILREKKDEPETWNFCNNGNI